MIDQCPTCNRKFNGIMDFPLIYIAGISIIKSDEIPKAIPHWYKEDLLEKKKFGYNREILPAEVLTYFNNNLNEDELVHSDGFIYKRPLQSAIPKFYKRRHNYAPTLKKLIEENRPIKEYFQALGQVVGQEIPPSRILPNWEQDKYFSFSAYQIPNTNKLTLNLNEGEQIINGYPNGYRVCEINLFGVGPNIESPDGPTLSQILQVGHITYEGRVHSK